MSTLVSGHQAIRPSQAGHTGAFWAKDAAENVDVNSPAFLSELLMPRAATVNNLPFSSFPRNFNMQTWLILIRSLFATCHHWVIICRWIRVLSCSVVFSFPSCHLVPSRAPPLGDLLRRRSPVDEAKSLEDLVDQTEAHEISWNRVSEIFWNLSRQCFKMFQWKFQIFQSLSFRSQWLAFREGSNCLLGVERPWGDPWPHIDAQRFWKFERIDISERSRRFTETQLFSISHVKSYQVTHNMTQPTQLFSSL